MCCLFDWLVVAGMACSNREGSLSRKNYTFEKVVNGIKLTKIGVLEKTRLSQTEQYLIKLASKPFTGGYIKPVI